MQGFSYFSINSELYSIRFYNEFIGIAIGDDGSILKTSDGGENWEYFEEPSRYSIYQSDITENGYAYLACNCGGLLKGKVFDLMVDFSINNDTICLNNYVNVTYNGNANETAEFIWDFNNAEIITGDYSGPYTLKWDEPGEKEISLTVNQDIFSNGPVSKVILVNDIPEINCLYSDTVTVNNTFIIDAGEGFEEYFWNTRETEHFIEVLPKREGLFEYWVTVTDENACQNTDSIQIIVVDKKYNVLPNPAQDYLFFTSNTEEDIYVEIFDVTGKETVNFSYNFNKTLNIAGFKRGIYFLKITMNDNFFIERIVFQ